MGKLATKTGHSSYWLDEDLWFNDDTDDDIDDGDHPLVKSGYDINKIIRLATVRRAISNFVSILSGKNVPVQFQGEESYTDGNVVIIAADDNPKNFDVAVGLALHEASHILLSDFRWLKMLGELSNKIMITGNPSLWYTRDPNISTSSVRIEASDNHTIVDSIFRPEIIDSINKTYNKFLVQYPEYTGSASAYGTIVKEHIKYIKTIMNLLEDRRIDRYVYNTAIGYRPYYNALYNKYFHTIEVGKMLRLDASARIPSIENYINHMIYHIHPDSDPDALPGLRTIFKEMDLDNVDRLSSVNDYAIPEADIVYITYEKTPQLWQKANDLMAMILKYVELYIEFENSNGEGDEASGAHGDSDASGGGGEGDSESEAGEDDWVAEPSSPSDMKPRDTQTPRNKRDANYNPDKALREMAKVADLMNGEVAKKKISKANAASVRAFEQAGGEMVDISVAGLNKVKCMVTKNITEDLLEEDWFLFSSGVNAYNGWVDSANIDAINAGRRMGQILHQRLQIRNDPMTTRQTRLSSGKIERRLLANLGMDNTDVFFRSRTDKHKPVMLHLTIDASGSMSGSKFRNVITVATAIAYLSGKMDNVDCVISIRGGDSYPIVAVVFDSRRDHFRKWMKYTPHLYANGNTPEGLCFAATMDLILESKDTHDVYFINFSDGMPGFLIGNGANINRGVSRDTVSWYQNELAYDHTRKMVKHLKENGVKVLSYFISDGHEWGFASIKKTFSYMYGEDAEFVNVTSVTDVLSTLNKRLAKR